MTLLYPQGLHARGAVFAPEYGVIYDSNQQTYHTRNPSVTGDRRKLTINLWMQPIGSATDQFILAVRNAGATGTELYICRTATGKFQAILNSAATWNITSTPTIPVGDELVNVHFSIDTDQPVDADKIIMEIDGATVTAFDTYSPPPTGTELVFNLAGRLHVISRAATGNSNYLNQNAALYQMVDGLYSDSAPFLKNGNPVLYSGDYGTNGLLLEYADDTDLGKDTSGKGNNWTQDNFTTDSQILTPLDQWSIWNEADRDQNTTLSDGGLSATSGSSSQQNPVRGTLEVAAGAWFYTSVYDVSAGVYPGLGVMDPTEAIVEGQNPTNTLVLRANGDVVNGTTTLGTWGLGAIPSGGKIAIAFDVGLKTVWFGSIAGNGVITWDGDPDAKTGGWSWTWTTGVKPVATFNASSGVPRATADYGQRGFDNDAGPPAGYLGLSKANGAT